MIKSTPGDLTAEQSSADNAKLHHYSGAGVESKAGPIGLGEATPRLDYDTKPPSFLTKKIHTPPPSVSSRDLDATKREITRRANYSPVVLSPVTQIAGFSKGYGSGSPITSAAEMDSPVFNSLYRRLDISDAVTTVNPIASVRRKSTNPRNFTHEEDILVISGYLNSSRDVAAIVDYPHSRSIWGRICKYFEENGGSSRTKASLKSRWTEINSRCVKFAAFLHQADTFNKSGQIESGKVVDAQELYCAELGKPFQYGHCWELLKDSPKWRATLSNKKQRTINEANSFYTNVILEHNSEFSAYEDRPRQEHTPSSVVVLEDRNSLLANPDRPQQESKSSSCVVVLEDKNGFLANPDKSQGHTSLSHDESLEDENKCFANQDQPPGFNYKSTSPDALLDDNNEFSANKDQPPGYNYKSTSPDTHLDDNSEFSANQDQPPGYNYKSSSLDALLEDNNGFSANQDQPPGYNYKSSSPDALLEDNNEFSANQDQPPGYNYKSSSPHVLLEDNNDFSANEDRQTDNKSSSPDAVLEDNNEFSANEDRRPDNKSSSPDAVLDDNNESLAHKDWQLGNKLSSPDMVLEDNNYSTATQDKRLENKPSSLGAVLVKNESSAYGNRSAGKMVLKEQLQNIGKKPFQSSSSICTPDSWGEKEEYDRRKTELRERALQQNQMQLDIQQGYYEMEVMDRDTSGMCHVEATYFNNLKLEILRKRGFNL